MKRVSFIYFFFRVSCRAIYFAIINTLFLQYQRCGKIFKEFFKMDPWRYGSAQVFWYGNFDVETLWRQKTLAALDGDVNLPTSKDYNSEVWECCWLVCIVIPGYLMLGLHVEAASLLSAIGFTWNKEGFDNFELWLLAIQAANPLSDRDMYLNFVRIAIFLSSPDGTIDAAEVNEWIPSPSALADFEKTAVPVKVFGSFDVTSFGARAFLKLGRDDDACELARLAMAPEQGTMKGTTRVACCSILGEVAAKRGDMDEADGHFVKAQEEAKTSRLPMLELLAARDWKQHVLEPAGKDCSAAEETIKAACATMKKTREQLAAVL